MILYFHAHHIGWNAVLENFAAVLTAVSFLNVLNYLLLALLASQIEVLVLWLDIRDEATKLVELVLVACVVAKLHTLVVLLNPGSQLFD